MAVHAASHVNAALFLGPAHPPTLTWSTIAIIAAVVAGVFLPFVAYALVQRSRHQRKHDDNVESGIYTDAKILRVERKGTAADVANILVTLEIQLPSRGGAPAARVTLTSRVALPLSRIEEVRVGNVVPVRFAPPDNVEVLLARLSEI